MILPQKGRIQIQSEGAEIVFQAYFGELIVGIDFSHKPWLPDCYFPQYPRGQPGNASSASVSFAVKPI